MLRDSINGFCMALADSVPGVSGGTVAFIMGFYDRFIGSIDDLTTGRRKEKKQAFTYLVKLGIGWIIGMGLAVLILSALFESNIYIISSLFLGFVAGAIPLIMREEKECLKESRAGILFFLIGVAIVAGITWANGQTGTVALDLAHFSIGTSVRLFLIGMIAISAMFLPGISGSTLLLIFGAYIPVIHAIKSVLALEFSYIPCLIFFGCGILTGAVTVVKMIRISLEQYRCQTVYLILGMMVGSFYAIIMGPTTLKMPQAALNFGTFHILAALVGAALVLGMQMVKERK